MNFSQKRPRVIEGLLNERVLPQILGKTAKIRVKIKPDFLEV